MGLGGYNCKLEVAIAHNFEEEYVSSNTYLLFSLKLNKRRKQTSNIPRPRKNTEVACKTKIIW